jgi:hypothetical protein
MTITLTREEAQQVLECMETAIKAGDWVVDGACDPDFILYLLRARLAQPEPEPVAWAWVVNSGAGYYTRGVGFDKTDIPFAKHIPLYATPPQREWQELTDKEVLADDVLRYHFGLNGGAGPVSKKGKAVIEAIEAKLKEKNT